MPNPEARPLDDACYLALKARDARFDGVFFTGVTSTSIYCRPVCRVRTPKRENCRFFSCAAQAEKNGFRPCLRCRPELAPSQPEFALSSRTAVWSMQDASAILANQAVRLLETPQAWSHQAPTVQALALRLGISARHLHRIFESCLGVSPLQYLQTRRLLNAKLLLSDTHLPIAQVARLSGFASERRFHSVFAQQYQLRPSAMRKLGKPGKTRDTSQAIELKLAYRPDYDVQAMLQFFAKRDIAGMEQVSLSPDQLSIGKTLTVQDQQQSHSGWLQARFDTAKSRVELKISESLGGVVPQVMALARALLDLDAHMPSINAVLNPFFPGCEGMRLPGCLDGFEMAIRAVLGQQITVAAARTLTARLVAQFGTPLAGPVGALNRLFPSPQALSLVSADALGQLGIVKQRQAAVLAIANAVAEQRLELHPGADVSTAIATLKTLPGVGDWTAQYIAMRALRWPDAFPAGDVALHKALGLAGNKHAAQEALLASKAWQPWRSYAVIRAWAAPGPAKSQPQTLPNQKSA